MIFVSTRVKKKTTGCELFSKYDGLVYGDNQKASNLVLRLFPYT